MYYLQSLPLILIFSVGIILSLLHFQKNRKIALISLVAFTIFLIQAVLMPYLSAKLPLMLINSGNNPAEVGEKLFIIYTIISVFMMIPWILILISIFRERNSSL